MTALAHPLRLEILRRLTEPASPTQLAEELAQPLGNVSYHVRILAKAGLLELDRTEARRGALMHVYRRSRTARKRIGDAGRGLVDLADAFGR